MSTHHSNFSKNIARNQGGGIHISSSANASLSFSTFEDNSAITGGGAYCEGFSTLVSIINCYNISKFNFIIFKTFLNGNFTANKAESGGALHMVHESYLYTVSSGFSFNSAQSGGAVFITNDDYFMKVFSKTNSKK